MDLKVGVISLRQPVILWEFKFEISNLNFFKALALRPRITPGVPLSVKRRVLITRDSVRSVTEDEASSFALRVRRANDSTALQRLPSLSNRAKNDANTRAAVLAAESPLELSTFAFRPNCKRCSNAN